MPGQPGSGRLRNRAEITRYVVYGRRATVEEVAEHYSPGGKGTWSKIYLTLQAAELDKLPTEEIFELKLVCRKVSRLNK